MALPTPVNGQITDIVTQQKDKAREIVDLVRNEKYDDAINALEEMIDPEFGLKPARNEVN